MIVEFPTAAHEIGDLIFNYAGHGPDRYLPGESRPEVFRLPSALPPNLEARGTTTVKLQDGDKSCDHGIFDATQGLKGLFKKFPTVVCEVAFRQSSENLAMVCGRWIACSLGRVLLAVGIDIKLEKEAGEKGFTDIASVFCSIWELAKAEPLEFDDIPSGVALNVLYRDDKYKNKQMLTGIPPSTNFFCISELGVSKKTGKAVYVKYYAHLVNKYQVRH